MAKKNRIFSGDLLSEKERKQIEIQLAKSRARDIAAMQKTNELRQQRGVRKRTNKIKKYVGGARTGTEAHDRYKAIMNNVKKSDRDEVRGMDYEDVFTAADALVDEATGYWSAEELENYIMDYLDANERL